MNHTFVDMLKDNSSSLLLGPLKKILQYKHLSPANIPQYLQTHYGSTCFFLFFFLHLTDIWPFNAMCGLDEGVWSILLSGDYPTYVE